MAESIPNQHYTVLGLMSGSSLDGLDLAMCNFWYTDKWHYEVLKAYTLAYSDEWLIKLQAATILSGFDLAKLHHDYGTLLGSMTASFLDASTQKPILVSSHGHTIFHQPALGFTLQIGSGAAIHAKTLLPVICDFRTLDVALGGQGAPLVPVGDIALFPEYSACLNLGGISNISYWNHSKHIAYDICPFNQVLNYFAHQAGLPYDAEGQLSAKGQINEELLKILDSFQYYSLPYPKSLANEQIQQAFLPLFPKELGINDCLATMIAHSSSHIANAINSCQTPCKVLVTGGGAWNTHFMSALRQKVNQDIELIIPAADTVNYKEAIIFAKMVIGLATAPP